MRLFSSKQRWIAVAALILLILFLLRPGASRLKSRIITSISAGVGRPVDIGAVHLRLLPRPGFELQNLVVYDDPSFGAEPMLRATEVTANLRIASLFRGRIEIARLDLTEPSLNLVHRENGGWNLEALLERAAHIPLAPIGNVRSVPNPRFPYIEGSSGRINFKSGNEKRPYALIDADFSLWQDSDNAWGMRLKAQPFRTDLNLNDVGELQVSGTWQRAQTIRETPVQFNIEWSKAQVGQLTKFFSGRDKGWRGNIQFDALLTGSPAKLKITSTASVDDFRRYDITSGEAVRLNGHCDGEYRAETHDFREVLCSAPVGSGLLTLTGDLALPGRKYAISLKAEKVPASAALLLLARAKKNLPDDVEADGTLEGTATIRNNAGSGGQFRFEGGGEIADFHLSSSSMKAEFGPTTVPFQMEDDSAPSRKLRPLGKSDGKGFPKGAYVEVGPVTLNAAHNGAATIRGWVNRTGYRFVASGETETSRVLRLARLAGIPTIASTVDGPTQLNLQIAGSWEGPGGNLGIGFPAPQVSGSAKLRDVRITIPGTSEPVDIASAEIQLAADGVRVQKLNAKVAGTTWSGTLDMPRGCGVPDACSIRFVLNADDLVLDRVAGWVNGRPKSRPWYRVLESTSKPGPSLLARLHAAGHLTAGRLLVHGVSATKLSANVSLQPGKLLIAGLDADLFAGKHRGKWLVDFSTAPSVCNGTGTVTGLTLANVANHMKDDWISGTATGTYEMKGPCTADFWQSVEGRFEVDVRNGVFPHVLTEADAEPLAITRLSGQAQLHSGKFEVTYATLISPKRTYELSGTVTLQREINLKMANSPSDPAHAGYEITGTLAEPHVAPLSNPVQANLKTVSSK